ncbi:MAG TPA: hypothetical protein VFG43_15265 [Geminicoccaceae bacterium]|nr:hypothetical protein [Geminicoccaceae bacterium]
MLLRLRRYTLFTLVALAVTATPVNAAEPAAPEAEAGCRGVALARFERDLPAGTRRYDIGAHLVGPFAALWARAPRSAEAAATPNAVTVYARQDRPLLVAYRAKGCVLAVLAVARDELWRALSDQLGQPV